MKIPIKRVHPDAVIPSRAHPGDAGADLVSVESVKLAPGERTSIGTGIAIALPEGWAALVTPRSGLAAKHGIGVVNGPGLIDAGYRGEIRVLLVNHDPVETFEIEVGMRVAQLVFIPVPEVDFCEVDELPASVRGEGGFGSTGR
ncbi:MAG: dUTP diphosphatase [Actinomycetota bacterium]